MITNKMPLKIKCTRRGTLRISYKKMNVRISPQRLHSCTFSRTYKSQIDWPKHYECLLDISVPKGAMVKIFYLRHKKGVQ